MRWKGQRQSSNVEDRRGKGGVIAGGGVGVVIIAIVVMLLGGDPSSILGPTAGGSSSSAVIAPQDEEGKEFVSVVLADTEDVWHAEFEKRGKTYRDPKLVLFSGQVESACGNADSAVGPFYCPIDETVYIDLSFYSTLRERFGATGEFAQAYVIAHEVGHHVSNLLGAMEKVDGVRGQVSEKEQNALSVRLELQADFYAGVFAHHADRTKDILDPSDITDALNAASAIGDDNIQRQSQGYVVPDAFTHGTSEQRVRWFKKGWDSGKIEDGDTFSARRL
jgi:predicted metalloprotease